MEKKTINPREWLGKQVREYLFTDIIGSGGMSAVFKGTHTKLKINRAIKVLRPDLAADRQFVRRFEQEAQILAILEHPNLIRVYEFFEEGGYLFIVMEIAEGDSLEDLVLYHGVIPAKEMWTIVSQAAAGLTSAHEKGIIHRDLSPDNIMVAGYDDGQISVKVIDFGIARQDAMDSHSKKIMETGTTTSGAFLGKLRYCSPEQAMELPVDKRSDQYTLALIFLESITGKPAFEGGSPVTMLMRRVNEPPPRLTDLVPGSSWPSSLDRVLDRAMQSSPSERYASLSEFSEALAEALGVSFNNNDDTGPMQKAKSSLTRSTQQQPTDELVFGVTGLADTMEIIPDRTIYPGKAPVHNKPRHGTVKAPPPPKVFPWKRTILAVCLLGMASAYFLVSDERKTQIKTQYTELKNTTFKKVESVFEADATPTPLPRKTPPKTKKATSPADDKEPYWMSRPGVVKPRPINPQSLELPVHMKKDYPDPVVVPVQCIVLRNGQPTRTVVMNSVEPVLDRLAAAAVEEWKFKPGTYRGKPADIIMDVEVTFE